MVSGDPRIAVHVSSGGGASGGGASEGGASGGGASSWVLAISAVTRQDAGRWGAVPNRFETFKYDEITLNSA